MNEVGVAVTLTCLNPNATGLLLKAYEFSEESENVTEPNDPTELTFSNGVPNDINNITWSTLVAFDRKFSPYLRYARFLVFSVMGTFFEMRGDEVLPLDVASGLTANAKGDIVGYLQTVLYSFQYPSSMWAIILNIGIVRYHSGVRLDSAADTTGPALPPHHYCPLRQLHWHLLSRELLPRVRVH